jgi:serralysin
MLSASPWRPENEPKFGSGNDVVNDFNQGNLAVGSSDAEYDLIDVQAYFDNWTDLQAEISDDGSGNAVIHLSTTDSITLVGVQTANLLETDFII